MMTLREAFALAIERQAAGKPAEARAIYDQILAAFPEHPGALLKIAHAEHAGGRLDRACELLERALRSAVKQGLPAGDIWLALGQTQLARRQFDAAERALQRARDLGRKTSDLFRSLAWLQLERGDAE